MTNSVVILPFYCKAYRNQWEKEMRVNHYCHSDLHQKLKFIADIYIVIWLRWQNIFFKLNLWPLEMVQEQRMRIQQIQNSQRRGHVNRVGVQRNRSFLECQQFYRRI